MIPSTDLALFFVLHLKIRFRGFHEFIRCAGYHYTVVEFFLKYKIKAIKTFRELPRSYTNCFIGVSQVVTICLSRFRFLCPRHSKNAEGH